MKTATAKRSHKILSKVEFDPASGRAKLRGDHDHDTLELKVGDEEMEHIKLEYEERNAVLDPLVRMPFCCFLQIYVSSKHKSDRRRHIQKSNKTPGEQVW
jgi:hypothetical protein